jgi:hypothetical protein
MISLYILGLVSAFMIYKLQAFLKKRLPLWFVRYNTFVLAGLFAYYLTGYALEVGILIYTLYGFQSSLDNCVLEGFSIMIQHFHEPSIPWSTLLEENPSFKEVWSFPRRLRSRLGRSEEFTRMFAKCFGISEGTLTSLENQIRLIEEDL